MNQTAQNKRRPHVYRRPRQRGAAAILAMMFLVIFSSLAAAMAIVAQGNLTTADAHLKINRALASAETGMNFLIYRIDQVTATIKTRDGLISQANAPSLWDETKVALLAAFEDELHNIEEPYLDGDTLHVGPVSLGPGAPTFTAVMQPHPIAGENYASGFYQKTPYSELDPPVSNANPLDATWIRVSVTAHAGPSAANVGANDIRTVDRTITMDFRMDKKIRFAVLSKSRVMIGRNVYIEGTIGSRFTETHLEGGHPVQMESDFSGLNDDLDDDLQLLANTLAINDRDYDNRINLASVTETDGIDDPEALDFNSDGYIDDYDFFIKHYDDNGDLSVTATELDTASDISLAQLLELIDTSGDPGRPGYGDGVIDNDDDYTKLRGQISLAADFLGWHQGAANQMLQDYFRGPISPDLDEVPLTFQASNTDVHEFQASDFNTASFKAMADGDLATQAADETSNHDPNDPESPQPLGETVRESVPFEAAHPYDYYDRPVYENMTFRNVRIPKGTNALFRNCRFIGVTYIETAADNTDPMFNFAGMMEATGEPKHPDREATVDGSTVTDTKTVSNNVRFHNCTFEGNIVSDTPDEFTHVRNKVAFTGKTDFKIDDSSELTSSEKLLFKRATILTPHVSVEMGTFIAPYDSNERIDLSGTIVGGVIDMRGNVYVNGSVITTFEPKSNTGPVLGETSPQFNTTLGYFSSAAGDKESELPQNGIGIIQVRYDPTIPLPDGILGPIEIRPVLTSYFEGTSQ